MGSSPLARGLPPRSRSRGRGRGIIPARAGFTVGVGGRCLCAGDHPRSRGVYPAGGAGPGRPEGSSPLARGLLRIVFPACRRAPDHPRSRGVYFACRTGSVFEGGIIPARAGFTRRPPESPREWWDHPRSRGVYAIARLPPLELAGSSPLARGLLNKIGVINAHGGIIPARAGFTKCVTDILLTAGDHPRSRGVYVWLFVFVAGPIGSSPLARGLP